VNGDDEMLTTFDPPPKRTGPALTVEVTDGIAIITFNLLGESVNKLNRAMKDEFTALFDRIERDSSVRAAVLMSGKPDVWIAGADIEEFLEFKTAANAERLSRDGQMLLESLEKMRVPIIAAIHGACLGAGLETALACRYRIATDDPKTILALPEVQLGLIPGAGGTQRLPRLIGVTAALDMILTGKNVRGKKALQIGLINELVHPAILRRIAVQRAREIADGKRMPPKKDGGLKSLLFDKNPAGRIVVLRQAREQTLAKTKGKYPTPMTAIEAVAAGYSGGKGKGYREEARLFGEMAMTEASKQLIFLFFATTALKKDPGTRTPISGEIKTVKKLGILGAGFMGSGIASIAVQQGTLVRLKDADHPRVAKGFAAVRAVLKDKLTKRQITPLQMSDDMSLLTGTIDYSGFGNVDLVIEAVFEDPSVKHQVIREIEEVVKPDTIIASNTSTIPIATIAEASSKPWRVLGMHFFSPVHKMPLLEVITTPKTLPEVTASAVAYGKKLGKTVIVVNDGPGFYVNRILFPYLNEAGLMLDQGAPIEDVDKALVHFGFPVGPVTLIDEVGLDVGAKAGKIMADAFPGRLDPAKSFQAVVAAGRYGRKSKKGFYLYDEAGKKGGADETVYSLYLASGAPKVVKPGTTPEPGTPPPVPESEITQRTTLAMLNEAARALGEGIIRSPRDGDVGAVFGIGFPPYRGGPFRYMDSLGIAAVVEQLEELNQRFPGRFEPSDNLREMARTNGKFYPDDEGAPAPLPTLELE
jgi:3-hydroxyacyl-CoA dehydrogenase/enoyl-CoA hydratase/3-hydroxybutyryl-CoA epimerase